MTRYTLHVPLMLNDGTPTDESELATIEGHLLSLVGGFTTTDGIGAWRADDGTTYREPVRLYVADTDADVLPELRQLAERAARRLAQEAVYLTAAPIRAELIVPSTVAA